MTSLPTSTPVRISYRNDEPPYNTAEEDVAFALLDGTVMIISDETVETSIVSVAHSADGVTAMVICNVPGARIYCAAYDTSGKMLDVHSQPTASGQERYVFPLNAESASVNVFLLDAENRPLCANVRQQRRTDGMR